MRWRRLDRRILRSAALRLGGRNPDMSPDAFLQLVTGVAEQAVSARDQIDRFGTLVKKLDPGELRTQALAALERGRAAFDAGRFEDAEQAFAQVSGLRLSDLANVREAWKESVFCADADCGAGRRK